MLPVMLGLLAAFAGGVPNAGYTVISGATLVDVSSAGRGHADVKDSVVLIAHGRVVAAGSRRRVKIPAGARVINAQGKFLIPGLIDGDGAMRRQAFADAYLYEGVTTVVVPTAPKDAAIDGEVTIHHPSFGPEVITMAPISGYSLSGDILNKSPWTDHRLHDKRLDAAAVRAQVAAAQASGARVVAVDQDVWPDQLAVIVMEAHRRGMGVTAQLAFTTYPVAIHAGVDAFTRNDRYSTATTPPVAFEAYANDPMGPGSRPAVRGVCKSAELKPAIDVFGGALARSHTALMPILSMEATADDVGGPNPWTLRSAKFVTPADLDSPVDPVTGARPYLMSHAENDRARVQGCARSKQAIDRELHAQGAVYLAGTSTPSYGVIPGGGLHGELKLLQGIGLTPREALAAATDNIATALHLKDRGRVAPGRRADLVILTEDPRKDVAAVDAIDTVMVAGEIVDRADLMAHAVANHPT